MAGEPVRATARLPIHAPVGRLRKIRYRTGYFSEEGGVSQSGTLAAEAFKKLRTRQPLRPAGSRTSSPAEGLFPQRNSQRESIFQYVFAAMRLNSCCFFPFELFLHF